MNLDLKNKAISLRQRGYSFREVSKKLDIPQNTASSWIRKVKLNKSAKDRILKISRRGVLKGLEVIRKKRSLLIKQINEKAENDWSELNWLKSQKKIACALMYWCEGSKNDSCLTFMNSDPVLVKTFISLLRSAFDIDESKFRICLHLHGYHNESEQKRYWSKVTGISSKYFFNSHYKANTGINKRPNYPGCASLRYHDSKILLEIKALINILGKKFGGVV